MLNHTNSCQRKPVVRTKDDTTGISYQDNPSVIGKASTAGITLVALVVTIVVLLILAGITIMYVLGDNGIFGKTSNAKEETEKRSAIEKVQLMLTDYMPEKHIGTKTLEEYLNEQKAKGNLDNVKNNKDGTITVEANGYEITIQEDDLSIVRKEKAGGVIPTFEIKTTKVDGSALTGDETEKAITINITNIAEYGENYTIEVKSQDGTSISKETNVINGVTGQASYKIKKKGTYTITVIGTKEGISKTATKTETITVKLGQIEETATFSRANGVIDIVWLNKDNTVRTESEGPLSPKGSLGNLTAIKYNGTKWVRADEDNKKNTDGKNDWYNYVAQQGSTQSGGTSQWANAVANFNEESGTGDAYFVWIPRYAYKITYFDTEGKVIGYSDIRGIIDVTDGTEKLVKGSEPSNLAKTGNEINKVKSEKYADYIPHPAFEFDGAKAGIWVGKFEASSNTPSATNGGGDNPNLNVRIVPNTTSWRDIKVSNMYTVCSKMTKGGEVLAGNTGDSHMMKNTEWGAVAYLAESKYGRNRTEISRNNSTSYLTGGENYTSNVEQSTTGNIYGIYDMNGGAEEYVAAYIQNNTISTNGQNTNLYQAVQKDRKYADVYTVTTDDQATNYSNSKGIKGDAIYETSNRGSDATTWYNGMSLFPYTGGPMILRGRLPWKRCGDEQFCFQLRWWCQKQCSKFPRGVSSINGFTQLGRRKPIQKQSGIVNRKLYHFVFVLLKIS